MSRENVEIVRRVAGRAPLTDVRIDTVGRIVSGANAGSLVWVERGASPLEPDSAVGYIEYVSEAKDFSPDSAFVWFSWHETLEDVERSSRTANRVIEWLDEPTPERFR